MKPTTVFSRRTALGVLMASPLLTSITLPAEASSVDAHLHSLGREFNAAAAQLDHAIAHKTNVSWNTLEQLARLDAEIVAMQASTIEGMRVKARAACWALLGDLDPTHDSTTDKKMALSIVRDLIRLYDPKLEHPNSLKELVMDLG
jgi:hypothetical protein